MVADSCSSRGMVCRPARIEMPKNGRPRHVLTMMIETMAMVGVPSQDGPVVASPLTTSRDRKSTRLNSSHGYISYAVFCLKKKKKKKKQSHIKKKQYKR